MNGYIKRSVWFGIGLSGCLAITQSALAASFDCAKASTNTEKMICADAGLSKLDEDLSAAYKTALQNEKQADSIRQAQKQWMKERNGCEDTACVKRTYEARLSSLGVAHTSSSEGLAAKQNAAPPSAQAKADAASVSHTEDVCLAPKIDWRNYRWTLITGKGEAVCEEMLAYLKSRPADAPPPTCPEERLPNNGNWTRPESRVLSEEDRQTILRDMPEKYRHFPMGVSYERWIRDSKLLRVIRGDITRDGIPESLLAISSEEYRQSCERSKRCARDEEIFKGGIVLSSDGYSLFPMNDAGTQVNWQHAAFAHGPFPPLLTAGELIYYKGHPYWLDGISWSQTTHDDFAHYSMRPWDVNSRMFSLVEVSYSSKNHPARFEETWGYWPQILDPENKRYCRIGYFHRDNLKQNLIRKGK